MMSDDEKAQLASARKFILDAGTELERLRSALRVEQARGEQQAVRLFAAEAERDAALARVRGLEEKRAGLTGEEMRERIANALTANLGRPIPRVADAIMALLRKEVSRG